MASDILQLAVFTVLCSPPSLLLFNRALHSDQGEPSTHNKKRLWSWAVTTLVIAKV